MLRLRCAWGTFIGHFCGNYFYYFLLAWLPTYLVQEEHLSIRSMSRLTAAIFLLIACSTLVSGWISDRLIARGASPTVVRLKLVVGGQVMASSLLALSRWFTAIRWLRWACWRLRAWGTAATLRIIGRLRRRWRVRRWRGDGRACRTALRIFRGSCAVGGGDDCADARERAAGVCVAGGVALIGATVVGIAGAAR